MKSTRRSVPLFLFALMLVAIGACGDDSTPVDSGADTGGSTDSSTPDAADSGTTPDAGDTGTPMMDAMADATADADVDAGTDAAPDSGFPIPDAGGACHGYDFGEPAATLMMVASLPMMTGGDIPLGIYDLTEARTMGDLTGTIRSTWVFQTDTLLQTLDQIALGGATPPTPTPRSNSYSTAAAMLMRARTCEGADTFDNGYSVRVEGGDTFLDVRSGGLLFTYRQRA